MAAHCQHSLPIVGRVFIPKGLFFTVSTLDLIGCYCWIAAFNYLLSKQTPTPHPD